MICPSFNQEGPGLGYTSHRISESLRIRIQIKLLQGLTNADIVQQNKDEFLTAFMAQQQFSITDRIAAAAKLAQSKPPKDYFLTSTDVANIRRGLDKRDWLFSNNPQESVVMWARQHSADVLYIDQQQPIPGTADHAFLAGSTQDAGRSNAAAQSSSIPRPVSQSGVPISGSQSSHISGDDSVPADAVLEPAFDGADDDLSMPEAINLERDQQPHLLNMEGRNSQGKAFKFDADNWTPFSIGIMQDCNVDAAIRWGHNRPLQLGSQSPSAAGLNSRLQRPEVPPLHTGSGGR